MRFEIDDGIPGPDPDFTITLNTRTIDTDPTWQHVTATILFAGLHIDTPPNNAKIDFRLVEHTGDYSWAKLDNVSITAVPEPTTIALLGIGLVGMVGAEARRRRKKKTVDNS